MVTQDSRSRNFNNWSQSHMTDSPFKLKGVAPDEVSILN